eukprot:TRINITY_DN193_c0_g1_i7.p1 TRINITY_DN193_c0_g1~~TRINITY_DN193_c0_g1_i7.p1  ORF type:complete len:3028 (+),score=1113.20 TRINITY_DN193_c0_g1_i7:82-9165(+)
MRSHNTIFAIIFAFVAFASTAKWEGTAWGECIHDDLWSTSVRSRTINCLNDSGQIVSDTECDLIERIPECEGCTPVVQCNDPLLPIGATLGSCDKSIGAECTITCASNEKETISCLSDFTWSRTNICSVDLASITTAAVTSGEQTTGDASNVLDGDSTTVFEVDGLVKNGGDIYYTRDFSFLFTFNAPQLLKKVTLVWKTPSPVSFELASAPDAATFTVFKTISDQENQYNNYQTFDVFERSVKTIKLSVTGATVDNYSLIDVIFEGMADSDGLVFEWDTSDSWSTCSQSCGTGGTQSRDVLCKETTGSVFVEDTYCIKAGKGDKPITEQDCTGSACVTGWTTPVWGECITSDCDGAPESTHTRAPQCYKSVCSVLGETMCSEGSKPTESESCTGSCDAAWEITWDDCNAGCMGTATQSGRAVCMRGGQEAYGQCGVETTPSRECANIDCDIELDGLLVATASSYDLDKYPGKPFIPGQSNEWRTTSHSGDTHWLTNEWLLMTWSDIVEVNLVGDIIFSSVPQEVSLDIIDSNGIYNEIASKTFDCESGLTNWEVNLINLKTSSIRLNIKSMCTAQVGVTAIPLDGRVLNPISYQTSEWSECSKPCDGGVRTRDVTCQVVIGFDDGDVSTVENTLCANAGLSTPSASEACNSQACSYAWGTEFDEPPSHTTCGSVSIQAKEVFCVELTSGKTADATCVDSIGARPSGLSSVSKQLGPCNEKCAEPVPPVYGSVVCTGNASSMTCTVSCDAEYTLDGNADLTCDNDNTFPSSDEMPVCVKALVKTDYVSTWASTSLVSHSSDLSIPGQVGSWKSAYDSQTSQFSYPPTSTSFTHSPKFKMTFNKPTRVHEVNAKWNDAVPTNVDYVILEGITEVKTSSMVDEPPFDISMSGRTDDITMDSSENVDSIEVRISQSVGSSVSLDEIEVLGWTVPQVSWSITPYGDCSLPCGNGTRDRTIECIHQSGLVIDDSFCEAISAKPSTSIACNTDACVPFWSPDEWSTCSQTCGGGLKDRIIRCAKYVGSELTYLEDSDCNGLDELATIEVCADVACDTTFASIADIAASEDACIADHCADKTLTTDSYYESPVLASVPGTEYYSGDHWVHYALSEVSNIYKVSIEFETMDAIRGFEIFFSEDDSTWTSVQKVDSQPSGSSPYTLYPALTKSVVKYVKIQMNTAYSSSFKIAQVQLMGTALTSCSDVASSPGVVGECTNQHVASVCEQHCDTGYASTGGMVDRICHLESSGGNVYWSGSALTCVEDVDNCNPTNPCENGGTCIDLVGDNFRCKCAPHFDGDTCEIAETFVWMTGEWDLCPAVCGGPQKTRNVWCKSSFDGKVDDSFCNADDKPDTSETCNPEACVYHWYNGSWSVCSKQCDGGTHERTVECRNQGDVAEDESHCIAGDKPLASEACNTDPCTAYEWDTTDWSSCSVACLKSRDQSDTIGFKTRDVFCTKHEDGMVVNEDLCDANTKFNTKQSCNNDVLCESGKIGCKHRYWGLRITEMPPLPSGETEAKLHWSLTDFGGKDAFVEGGVIPSLFRSYGSNNRYGEYSYSESVDKWWIISSAGAIVTMDFGTATKIMKVKLWAPEGQVTPGVMVIASDDGESWADITEVSKNASLLTSLTCQNSGYYWKITAPGYGACSAECGSGTETQSVRCYSDDSAANDGYCDANMKPPLSRSCYMKPCDTDINACTHRYWAVAPLVATNSGDDALYQFILYDTPDSSGTSLLVHVEPNEIWNVGSKGDTPWEINSTADNEGWHVTLPLSSGNRIMLDAGKHITGRSFHIMSPNHEPGSYIQVSIQASYNGRDWYDLKNFTNYPFGNPNSTKLPNCRADTFSWKESEWTTCTATCAGGTHERTVHCENGSGVTVADDLCNADDKPSESGTCNTHRCPYEWHHGELGECDVLCGGGHKTRDVWCLDTTANTHVSFDHCKDYGEEPLNSEVCNENVCEYEWIYGDYSACSKPCGVGTQTRDITCHSIDYDKTVEDQKCIDTEGPKPETSRECNRQKCPLTYEWIVGEWSECNEMCGTGEKTRTVKCKSSEDDYVSTDECKADKDLPDMPITYESCNTEPCTGCVHQHWKLTVKSLDGGVSDKITVSWHSSPRGDDDNLAKDLKPSAFKSEGDGNTGPQFSSSIVEGEGWLISNEDQSLIVNFGKPVLVGGFITTGPLLETHSISHSDDGFEWREVQTFDKQTESEKIETITPSKCGAVHNVIGDWSSCSKECSGTQTRTVTCISDKTGSGSSSCTQVPAKARSCDTEVCGAMSCMYRYWRLQAVSIPSPCKDGACRYTFSAGSSTLSDNVFDGLASDRVFCVGDESNGCQVGSFGIWGANSGIQIDLKEETRLRRFEVNALEMADGSSTYSQIPSFRLSVSSDGQMWFPISDDFDAPLSTKTKLQAIIPGCPAEYEWRPLAYGSCSKSCGGGTKTRSLECIKVDTSEVVAQGLCPSSDQPTTQTSCNTESCCGGGMENCWYQPTECPLQCGGRTQVEIKCMNSQGSFVDTDECINAGEKPDGYVDCPSCNWKCAFGSDVATLSLCSDDQCPSGGTREVVCCAGAKADNCTPEDREKTVCSDDNKPISICGEPCAALSCENGICDARTYGTAATCKCVPGYKGDNCATTDTTVTYEWVVTQWGDCSEECNTGSRTRSITCTEFPAGTKTDSFKCSGDAPSVKETCNAFACKEDRAVLRFRLAKIPLATIVKTYALEVTFKEQLISELASAIKVGEERFVITKIEPESTDGFVTIMVLPPSTDDESNAAETSVATIVALLKDQASNPTSSLKSKGAYATTIVSIVDTMYPIESSSSSSSGGSASYIPAPSSGDDTMLWILIIILMIIVIGIGFILYRSSGDYQMSHLDPSERTRASTVIGNPMMQQLMMSNMLYESTSADRLQTGRSNRNMNQREYDEDYRKAYAADISPEEILERQRMAYEHMMAEYGGQSPYVADAQRKAYSSTPDGGYVSTNPFEAAEQQQQQQQAPPTKDSNGGSGMRRPKKARGTGGGVRKPMRSMRTLNTRNAPNSKSGGGD